MFYRDSILWFKTNSETGKYWRKLNYYGYNKLKIQILRNEACSIIKEKEFYVTEEQTCTLERQFWISYKTEIEAQ